MASIAKTVEAEAVDTKTVDGVDTIDSGELTVAKTVDTVQAKTDLTDTASAKSEVSSVAVADLVSAKAELTGT
jgi:hypothetical protein